MGRLGLSLLTVFALSGVAFAADNLPEKEADDAFEVEPPILVPNRDRDEEKGALTIASPAPTDAARLEKQLERAKRSAGGAERLYKIGVLAKAEVELRILRMIELEAELENARLVAAKDEFALLEQNAATGAVSKEDLKQAEISLSHAISSARAAAAKRNEAEIEVAELNVKRQRQLLSLGSGGKSDVAKAEEKLAELKAQRAQ